MKLLEQDPRWYVLHDGGPRVGFTFECPHCSSQRLGIAVHDAGHRIISAEEPEAHPPGFIWEITAGADFHDISLSPSIDASKCGHWHGHITGGECQ
jgi:hypothetical protein